MASYILRLLGYGNDAASSEEQTDQSDPADGGDQQPSASGGAAARPETSDEELAARLQLEEYSLEVSRNAPSARHADRQHTSRRSSRRHARRSPNHRSQSLRDEPLPSVVMPGPEELAAPRSPSRASRSSRSSRTPRSDLPLPEAPTRRVRWDAGGPDSQRPDSRFLLPSLLDPYRSSTEIGVPSRMVVREFYEALEMLGWHQTEWPNQPEDQATTALERVQLQRWTAAYSETCCPICLASLATGDMARRMPCSHAFHAACLEQWFSTSGNFTCPTCRTPA